ncbi:hypothetical protein BGZ93_010588 [Podila epicladia]|nr:hypothetical protein BGZ92_000668 [Podila epicladia]KAG0088064.1 hypothetical protein BGZ93_010588 [Podila epicladia]
MHKSTPQLAIKTLFTPTSLVCLLALSLCTPTSTTALPIQRQSSSSPQSASAESIDSPFRIVARPITIQVDLLNNNEARLIEQTEQLEQRYRQQQQQQPHHPSTVDDQIRLALLVQEQDQLEREQQDRDQLLDNEEEAQEAQDPETRRREQEALGLWMSDAEIEALSQGTDEEGACNGSECAQEFDLFVEKFQEERNEEVVAKAKEGVHSSTLAPRSLAPDEFKRAALPTEEEMLQWPIVNQAQFLDREDETQDEYDEQA